MLLEPGAATSDAMTRNEVYGTILDFLVLAVFLGAISLVRAVVARVRRRAHKPEKMTVA